MMFTDLFCGCGGASLGLLRAGFRHFKAFDADADALASYFLLTKHRGIRADLSVESVVRLLGRFKGLIWMSPPCQPFSLMHNDEADARIALFSKVFEEVVLNYPDCWIVVENVANLIKATAAKAAMNLVYERRSILFDEERMKEFVLDSSDYGVAQERKRLLWIVPPKGTPVPRPPRKLTAKKQSFKDVIGHGFADPDKQFWHMTAKEHGFSKPTDRPIGYAPLNTWEDCPKTVLAVHRVFLHSGKYLHPSAERRLTVGECMAIQGLPLIKLCGSLNSRYRQVGNAVPPNVSQSVGKIILEAQ